MQFTSLFALAASLAVSHAAIVSFYEGTGCGGDPFNSRNIYDNTCATGTGGYQSFMITTSGGGGQYLHAYSQDACAGPVQGQIDATVVGQCYNVLNGNGYGTSGGANAMDSTTYSGF